MAQIRINVPAAGLPQIIGSPIEDQTLSVDLSNLDDGNGLPDWTYRYTAENTESGRRIAIDRALQDAGLRIAQHNKASIGKQ